MNLKTSYCTQTYLHAFYLHRPPSKQCIKVYTYSMEWIMQGIMEFIPSRYTYTMKRELFCQDCCACVVLNTFGLLNSSGVFFGTAHYFACTNLWGVSTSQRTLNWFPVFRRSAAHGAALAEEQLWRSQREHQQLPQLPPQLVWNSPGYVTIMQTRCTKVHVQSASLLTTRVTCMSNFECFQSWNYAHAKMKSTESFENCGPGKKKLITHLNRGSQYPKANNPKTKPHTHCRGINVRMFWSESWFHSSRLFSGKL